MYQAPRELTPLIPTLPELTREEHEAALLDAKRKKQAQKTSIVYNLANLQARNRLRNDPYRRLKQCALGFAWGCMFFPVGLLGVFALLSKMEYYLVLLPMFPLPLICLIPYYYGAHHYEKRLEKLTREIQAEPIA